MKLCTLSLNLSKIITYIHINTLVQNQIQLGWA